MYRVFQKLWHQRSGLFLSRWWSGEDNSFWYELHFSLIRGINQMEHKYRSFLNELRSFSLFSGIWGHWITFFWSALCLAAQSTPILKNEISSYSDDRDIKNNARVHYVGSGDNHLIEVHPSALCEPNQLLDSGVVSRNSLTRLTKCLITPSFQLGFA